MPLYTDGWAAPKDLRETYVCLALVAQTTTGLSYLSMVSLHRGRAAEAVIEQLRREYCFGAKTSYREIWLVNRLTKILVGTADILWVSSHGIGSLMDTF